MTPIKLPELIRIHDDLRRLLAIGQPPAVAVILCARFIEETEDTAQGWWEGFGFHVALEMARRIPLLSAEGIAPEEIARFERTLTRSRARPIPPLPGEKEWPEGCERALAILRRGSQAPPGAPAGRSSHRDRAVEIRVPVIHTLAGYGSQTHPLFADASAASILRLTVDADLVERGPDLVIDGPISAESRGGFEEAVATLGKLPHSGPRDALIRVRWTPEGRLVGRSASLPFLLAAAVARSRFSRGFRSVLLRGDVAATGDLEGMRVRPVEASTLAEKVRASYDAGLRRLVVPAEQESEARREATRLAEGGDGRSLEIIGVRDLRDAWHDERIVTRRFRTPRLILAGWLSWMTRSRIRIALVASAVLLLAALSIAGTIITRNVPTDVSWKGDDLLFRNRYGWITRRVHFPYEDKDSNPTIGPDAAVIDVEGRRVAVVIHGSAPGKPDRLAEIDRRGRLLWEISSTDIHGIDEESIRWKAFVPLLASGGPPEILAVRRSTQHGLTLVDRLDARTGVVLGELRNNGHLEWLAWVDPAKEGRRRPAIMGTNNENNRAILAILDVAAMATPARIDSIEDLPSITDSRSLARGVVAAWSFQKDDFTKQPRIACGQVADDDNGLTMVSMTDGTAFNAVNYYLRVADLRHPFVDRVQITDGYRAHLAQSDPAITVPMCADEEGRLAQNVQTLTAEGWRGAEFLQRPTQMPLGR